MSPVLLAVQAVLPIDLPIWTPGSLFVFVFPLPLLDLLLAFLHVPSAAPSVWDVEPNQLWKICTVPAGV